METVTDYFLGLQNHYKWWLQPWNKKMLAPWKKSYDQPRQHIKNQRHYFAYKGPSSQSYGFSKVMYGCESWTIKNASNYWTPNICQTIVKAMVFPLVMYYCESWTIKKAGNTEELMLLNCGVGEDSWKSLGLQRDKTSQSQRKSTLNIHWKNWCWSWNSKILASWCKEPTH